MSLKPGYKQTEVGVIPEDWEVVAVGSLATFTSGKGISVTALHRHSSDFPVPVFGGNGIAGYTTTPFVSERSIVVGRVGQKCGEVYVTDGPAWITDNALYPRRISRPLDVRYFALALEAAGLSDVKNRNDLPLITQSIVHAVRIAWPPDLAEQHAIAEALGDVDAVIGALGRLLAKKRDLKQAAMQQLLTGQTRLPGFGEEWERAMLGDVADVKTGPFGSSLHESDYVGDGTPIITVEHLGEFGVAHRNLPMVSKADRHRLAAYSLEVGDVVFSRVGSIDRNALIGEAEVGWLFSGRLLRVRPNGNCVDSRYLSYQFHCESFKCKVRNVAVGQTMASLNTQILKGISVVLPDLAEQTAIAAALSDMDAEIAALEQRLAKTRALKQGMMQELLTGRTRLV